MTANNAISQYDKVEYSVVEVVEGFYYKLDKMANQMVERPSDYAFHLRLFEGLPTWIYDTLLECNILPEFCNMEDICETVDPVVIINNTTVIVTLAYLTICCNCNGHN